MKLLDILSVLAVVPLALASVVPLNQNIVYQQQQLQQYLVQLQQYQQVFDDIQAPHCPRGLPLSCQNTTQVADSCCFDNTLFLSTQFWNYYPAIGGNETFTLHGLWPDNCDGSYEQFCDNKMNIRNVTEILQQFGEEELLKKMQEVWLNINHDDESLWLHEFNKHGTCVDTIKPSCYKKLTDGGATYKNNKNVVDFMKITMNLYEKLPTFQWLAEAGIHPSTEITYSRKQIEEALSRKFNALPFIKCNKYNGIQEIWYFHNSKGSLLQQEFFPIDTLNKGNCPAEGIKFYPKGSLGRQPPSPSPPGNGRGTRGYVKLSGQDGCLIRNGKWYVDGRCATYYLEKAPFGGHNLKTRAGYCAVTRGSGNALVCGRKTKAMQFQYDKETGELSLNGKSDWSADAVPRGRRQINVYPGSDRQVKFHLVFGK